MKLPRVLEVKYPFAYLINVEATSLFVRVGDEVLVHEDIPQNYPRWTFATLSLLEAHARVHEMKQAGWEIIQYDKGD